MFLFGKQFPKSSVTNKIIHGFFDITSTPPQQDELDTNFFINTQAISGRHENSNIKAGDTP